MSDDFLSRWSRRKREAEADPPEKEPAASPEAAAPASPGEDEGELLARLGLKHPDEMEQGDDFAAFLRAAVPQHLKTLALRKLWRSDPALACLDGLNDYDGDYTGTGVPAGGLKTSYQVGRGILRRVAEVAEEAASEEGPADETAAEEVAGDAPDAADSAGGGVGGAAEQCPPPERHAGAARRRMVFRPAAQRRGS